jgi:hypothetical protein
MKNDHPKWAKYLAMDYSTNWFYFENEPRTLGSKWQASGRVQFAGQGGNRRQWKLSLVDLQGGQHDQSTSDS